MAAALSLMYAYRNKRTGQVVESTQRRPRLERSPAWEPTTLVPGEGYSYEPAAGEPAEVWLCTAAHGRPAVTRLVMAQWAHVCEVLQARGVAAHGVVVACDENLEVAQEHGFDTVELDNYYLGRRFNVALSYACGEGATHVAFTGSDDWIHPDVFKRLPGPRTVMAGRFIAMVDLEGGRMRRCYIRGRQGVIPWIIPRPLLERCGWAPVKPEKRRGIDGSLARGVKGRTRGVQWAFHDPHEYARVDWKTGANITPYELVVRTCGRGPEVRPPWSTLAPYYPAELLAQAREVHEALREARVLAA